MQEELYTVEEVAKTLKVSEQVVRRWLRSGRLKGVRIGHLWRVRKSDLEKFLEGGGAHERG
jgi:excisionase family DNA binding protein